MNSLVRAKQHLVARKFFNKKIIFTDALTQRRIRDMNYAKHANSSVIIYIIIGGWNNKMQSSNKINFRQKQSWTMKKIFIRKAQENLDNNLFFW